MDVYIRRKLFTLIREISFVGIQLLAVNGRMSKDEMSEEIKKKNTNWKAFWQKIEFISVNIFEEKNKQIKTVTFRAFSNKKQLWILY